MTGPDLLLIPLVVGLAGVAGVVVTQRIRDLVREARALPFCCVCGHANDLQRNEPAPRLSLCWEHYAEIENELRELLGLPGRVKTLVAYPHFHG